MVARVALHGMCQDNNEPIRPFSAWIQGQAGVGLATSLTYFITCVMGLKLVGSKVLISETCRSCHPH